MRKFFITIIFLTLPVFTAVAETNKSNSPQLDAFLNLKTLSAEFTQENYYPGVDNFSHKGKVYIVRPEIALWDYENPVEYYLMEPGKITHYSKSLKQLIKMNVDSNNSSDPTGLLLGIFLDSSKVKEQFRVSEKDNTITLVPYSKLGLESIIITMNKNVVEQVYSKDEAGNAITIRFSKVKQNIPLEPSLFQKSLPEETHIFEQ